MWQDLWVAMCLVLVLEGLMPFISPQRWRQMLAAAALMDDRSIRVLGLIFMLLGTGLLYVVH